MKNFFDFLEENSNKIPNSMLLIISLISFMLNVLLILIHFKLTSLFQGFFIIVCIQIIVEALINVIILAISVFYLCISTQNQFLLILQIIFYFWYTTNVLLNLRIIFFLMTSNKEKQELIEYDSDDNYSATSIKAKKSRASSISLSSYSFKSIYIIPFLLSILLTVLYVIFTHYFYNNPGEKLEGIPYILGSYNKLELYNLFFYIFHFIYFSVSLIYLFLSINKERISNHIHLKSFSLYCFFNSFVSLLFPVLSILKIYFDNVQYIFSYLLFIIFLFYFVVTSLFRYRCYYIQFILGSYGNGFFLKLRYALKILFCCKKIAQPNFIDFNSNFVYHSLSNINDFNHLELASDTGETSSK
jgi:hypothetical protein